MLRRLLLIAALVASTTLVGAPSAQACSSSTPTQVGWLKILTCHGKSGGTKSSGGTTSTPKVANCRRTTGGWTCKTTSTLVTSGTVTVTTVPTPGTGTSTVFISDADMIKCLETFAGQATTDLDLPALSIKIGPEPTTNKWNMAVVGYPLWIWVVGGTRRATTVTNGGITIAITATRDNVEFDFGDGASETCTSMTRLPASFTPGDPSPDCGHTYTKASLPTGAYTVRATANWTLHWSAMGYTGTLPEEVTATRQLRVGELQSVTVRNGS